MTDERRLPGHRRRSKYATVWTLLQDMPHHNGDPAYIRARSDAGVECTFYCGDWFRMTEVPSDR